MLLCATTTCYLKSWDSCHDRQTGSDIDVFGCPHCSVERRGQQKHRGDNEDAEEHVDRQTQGLLATDRLWRAPRLGRVDDLKTFTGEAGGLLCGQTSLFDVLLGAAH